MLKEILQGMVVGLANIIPGVSGGTMMVAMGLYDRLIYSITHLFSDFKNSIKFLLPIFAGAGIAILLLARLFEYLLTYYPIPTNLAFCGLILGSLPHVYKHVQGKRLNASSIICFAIFFLMVVVMAAFSETGGNEAVLTPDVFNMIILFLIGVIAAATMVIPGVSGSMVLMLLGYYQPILNLVNDFIDDIITLNWPALWQACLLLIPFGLGVVVGIFAVAKLIEWIMARWPQQTYWAIIGLIAASPVAILMNTDWAGFTWIIAIIGAICFGAGWFAASRLGGD